LDINHRKKVNSALCAARKRVSKLTKTKSLTPLTRPTSLEMLLTGVSTSLRRLFAPAKGLPDSIVPIRQHGVQGQVLAITPLLPYQNINASQHTVSASRGSVRSPWLSSPQLPSRGAGLLRVSVPGLCPWPGLVDSGRGSRRTLLEPAVNPSVERCAVKEHTPACDEPSDFLGPIELAYRPHCCPSVSSSLLHAQQARNEACSRGRVRG